ncbi:hypothetical protein AVEN_74480-1 [Araneus ventricosus]|uniref:Uncharacterized protein n=1 Tax=Araneus ventricosus TaxID=182803 RepID=A0A4Y2QIY5_ARAVE|nr:hypothetical protein AVEN_74480-1 [Araneus ventricosus]
MFKDFNVLFFSDTRYSASEDSSSQPAEPLHYFGSNVSIVLASMQEKGESRMGKDRDCRQGDPISLIPGDECVLFCPLLCGVVHYIPRRKPHQAYCHSSSLVVSVRSFGASLHLFPALKSALSGPHFRSD